MSGVIELSLLRINYPHLSLKSSYTPLIDNREKSETFI